MSYEKIARRKEYIGSKKLLRFMLKSVIVSMNSISCSFIRYLTFGIAER